MDAIKLFSEWKNDAEARILTEIVDTPASAGGFDIRNVKNVITDIKCDTRCGEVSFEKNHTCFSIRVLDVSRVYTACPGITKGDSCDISIENGESGLVFLIKRNQETFSFIDFQKGSMALRDKTVEIS